MKRNLRRAISHRVSPPSKTQKQDTCPVKRLEARTDSKKWDISGTISPLEKNFSHRKECFVLYFILGELMTRATQNYVIVVINPFTRTRLIIFYN